MSLLFRAMDRDCSDRLIRVGFRIQICESLHCQASLSNIKDAFTIYTIESSNAWISWKSFWTPQENGKCFSFSAAWWDVIMGWSWHATPRLYTLSYKIWNKENSAQHLTPWTKILNPVSFLCCLISSFHARCLAGFYGDGASQWRHAMDPLVNYAITLFTFYRDTFLSEIIHCDHCTFYPDILWRSAAVTPRPPLRSVSAPSLLKLVPHSVSKVWTPADNIFTFCLVGVSSKHLLSAGCAHWGIFIVVSAWSGRL